MGQSRGGVAKPQITTDEHTIDFDILNLQMEKHLMS